MGEHQVVSVEVLEHTAHLRGTKPHFTLGSCPSCNRCGLRKPNANLWTPIRTRQIPNLRTNESPSCIRPRFELKHPISYTLYPTTRTRTRCSGALSTTRDLSTSPLAHLIPHFSLLRTFLCKLEHCNRIPRASVGEHGKERGGEVVLEDMREGN